MREITLMVTGQSGCGAAWATGVASRKIAARADRLSEKRFIDSMAAENRNAKADLRKVIKDPMAQKNCQGRGLRHLGAHGKSAHKKAG